MLIIRAYKTLTTRDQKLTTLFVNELELIKVTNSACWIKSGDANCLIALPHDTLEKIITDAILTEKTVHLDLSRHSDPSLSIGDAKKLPLPDINILENSKKIQKKPSTSVQPGMQK